MKIFSLNAGFAEICDQNIFQRIFKLAKVILIFSFYAQISLYRCAGKFVGMILLFCKLRNRVQLFHDGLRGGRIHHNVVERTVQYGLRGEYRGFKALRAEILVIGKKRSRGVAVLVTYFLF